MPGPFPTLTRIHVALLLLGLGLGANAGRSAGALDAEPSALLHANAGGPVDWLPWGEAAFARARQEKKPVFLFIGAFTSELTRTTLRQTFANADTAALLNQAFVCVLVDREEHPELAALYQGYLSQIKQLNGWPLNLWLTPDLRPYEGAAYLPPTEEWGKTSFIKMAQKARDAWTTDQAGCRTRAGEAVAQLAAAAPAAPAAGKLKEKLAAAVAAWRPVFDATHGGFGDPPKNPEPELLRFLLRQAPADREMALATLKAVAASALRDPLDGGFYHYASDAAWRLPYPQKLLADQARVALAYLDAAQGDTTKAFAPVARGLLDYTLARLARPDGTFAAAEDATADEFAGYAAWTEAEIDAALGADSAAFKVAHGVEAAGNVPADDDLSGRYKGRNLLHASLATEAKDAAVAAKLLAVRAARPAPPRDERATAGVHGLLLAALARGGAELAEPRYTAAAAHLFDTVKKEFLLSPGGDLRRLGGSPLPAAPADYTALALGCREFGRAAHRPDAEALAARLLELAAARFLDPKSGHFYATAAALPPGIFVRPPAVGEVPSAESLALQAGVPPAQAAVIAAALAVALDEPATPPPGDVLLAVSLQP